MIIGEGWRVTVLKEETVIPLGTGFWIVGLEDSEEGEKAVTMATGCGMRRMRRRILWDSEESVCCGDSGVWLYLEDVDEKGRWRHIDVVGCWYVDCESVIIAKSVISPGSQRKVILLTTEFK